MTSFDTLNKEEYFMTIAESLFSSLTANIKFFCDVHHNHSWKERKTKTDYTLWHLHQGHLWIELNCKTFFACEGDVVLFYPGDTYRAYTDESECSFLVTFFTLETANKLDLLENRQLAGVYTASSIHIACKTYCKHYHTFFQNNMAPTMQHYAAFLTFMSELLSCGPAVCFHDAPTTPEKLPLHEILDYMNAHYLEDLTVKELAKRMGMSEKYFIQYFHIQTGSSPKQYLVEKRMKHALLLLAEHNSSLSYVAAKLGYSDPYAFSKAFKKYYGEAPGSFRKHLI